MTVEMITALASVVSAIVGVMLLFQLYLTREQIMLARKENETAIKWNRIVAAYALISPSQLAESERDVCEALEQLKIKYISPAAQPLSRDQTEKVWNNEAVYRVVRAHLNLLEEYATAIRIGSIDKELAFALRSYAIVRATSYFQIFVDRAREHFDDPTIYIEMYNLLEDWKALRAAEYRVRQTSAKRMSVQTSYPSGNQNAE